MGSPPDVEANPSLQSHRAGLAPSDPRLVDAWLRLASEVAQVGAFDWNAATDTLGWESAATRRLLGRPPEEASIRLSRFLVEAVHPDEAEAFRQALSAGLAAGRFAWVGRVRLPDGRFRWIEWRGEAVDVPGAPPERMARIVAGLTGRDQARSDDAQRRLAIDSVPASISYKGITAAALEILATTLGVFQAGYARLERDQETLTIESDWHEVGVCSIVGQYQLHDFGGIGALLRDFQTVVINEVATDPLTAHQAAHWHALQIHAAINVPIVEQDRLAALFYINSEAPRVWTKEDIHFAREVAERTWATVERTKSPRSLPRVGSGSGSSPTSLLRSSGRRTPTGPSTTSATSTTSIPA